MSVKDGIIILLLVVEYRFGFVLIFKANCISLRGNVFFCQVSVGNTKTCLLNSYFSTRQEKIYLIRGQKVMLDADLAEMYGYGTKNFNRQVKNNIEKFEGEDFMFQLTDEEMVELSRCKNFTSSWGGSRYLPNAFTEQGVYMLMTVLRGGLAIKQSRALVRTFKQMKDFIIENQDFISSKENE